MTQRQDCLLVHAASLWPRKYSRSHGGYCLLTVYSLALCSANFFTYPRSACSEIVPSLVVWAPRIGHQLKLSLIDMTIGNTDLGSSWVEVTSYQVTLYHIKLTRKTSRYTLGYHEILASFFEDNCYAARQAPCAPASASQVQSYPLSLL